MARQRSLLLAACCLQLPNWKSAIVAAATPAVRYLCALAASCVCMCMRSRRSLAASSSAANASAPPSASKSAPQPCSSVGERPAPAAAAAATAASSCAACWASLRMYQERRKQHTMNTRDHHCPASMNTQKSNCPIAISKKEVRPTVPNAQPRNTHVSCAKSPLPPK